MGNQCSRDSSSTLQFQHPKTMIQSLASKQKNNHHTLNSKINGRIQTYIDVPPKKYFYDGQIKNSIFNGYGKLYQQPRQNQDIPVYEGEFKDGKFQGWGITDCYTGQFRDGMFDGFGVLIIKDPQDQNIVNLYYEGYFFGGVFSGLGIQIKDTQIPLNQIKDMQNYKGGMIDYALADIENGNALSIKNKTKEIYIGQFSNGFRHGVGRLFKNNKQCSGLFAGGQYKEQVATVINPNQNYEQPPVVVADGCFSKSKRKRRQNKAMN